MVRQVRVGGGIMSSNESLNIQRIEPNENLWGFSRVSVFFLSGDTKDFDWVGSWQEVTGLTMRKDGYQKDQDGVTGIKGKFSSRSM